MPETATVRRRQLGVLVVGQAEPELRSWLRGDGHAVRTAPTAQAALDGFDEASADLVVVDREREGREVGECCALLRDDPRLADAWLLAITSRRTADDALRAGADDFLHRPFTRGELLARVRAGLRAVRQRGDAAMARALMVNVPGAIYRSAWHAGHVLELISDEIERISGYPPVNFVTSTRRTLLSIMHPDDRERVLEAVAGASQDGPDRTFEVEYRIVRADGEVRWVLDRGHLVPGAGGRLWMDGAIVDITERRAEEERAARVRIVQAADAARRRIERDLHDGAQQRLVALTLQVRMAQKRAEQDPAAAAPFLQALGDELAEASKELRELARGLHPALLSERGLSTAVAALASRAPVPVEVLDLPERRLPEPLEATAYFTVAEALTNVAKYAGATQATVRVACEDDAVLVEVRDDGVGGARPEEGSGLAGLAERVGAVDGRLELDSPPGAGTLLRAVLPLRDTEIVHS